MQVLDAVARVFGLDQVARDYLHGLAGASPAPRRRTPRTERVPSGTLQLVDVIGLPAFVEDRSFDVLAANALATELAPGLRAGENRLRTMFLDDAESARYPDWQDQMAGMVAAFRASIGTDVQDPGGHGTRGRAVPRQRGLPAAVGAARRPAARGRGRSGCGTRSVGDLELRREKLGVGGTDGQLLVVHHAEPGSASAERLAVLASLAASRVADRVAD